MKYQPLFNLRILHNYYSDGHCPDFRIEPTNETSKLLKNHRSSTRTLSDGVSIVTAVTDTGDAFLPVTRGDVFKFNMYLKNINFTLITEVSDSAIPVSPIYTNLNSTINNKDLELLENEDIYSEKFVINQPSSEELFVLSGQPAVRAAVDDFRTETSGPPFAVQQYNNKNKLLSINTESASNGKVFLVKYPVTVPVGRDVFAQIEIHVNDSFANTASSAVSLDEFRISFKAKKARWAYYCLTDLSDAESAYSIVDTPPDDEGMPLLFSAANRRDLVENPDDQDHFASELADQHSSLKRYRFLSDVPVTCQQAARKHLSLRVNGNQLPGALSNPSLTDFTKTKVTTGDVTEQQDWLFRVIKVLTNTGA